MKKINIAELLKDCPEGTKLYSPLCGECYFDRLNIGGTIICKKQNTQEITFTSKGYYMLPVFDDCECLLFPSKENRDWSKFQRPFKDGDILTYTGNYTTIFIYRIKENEPNYSTSFYVACNDAPTHNFLIYNKYTLIALNENCDVRLATPKEKQQLFDAINENGYKWNDETKTLEKLVESEEDTDDRVVMSGIYFDRENYADEVELHLGNYEIEIRNGKTYAIFKNQKTETLKPKFKVGDIIANGKTTIKIGYIDDDYYYEIGGNIANRLYIKNQDDWELVKDNIKPKFKVGDRIIKRDSIVNSWIVSSVSSEYYGLQLPNRSDGIGVLPIVEQDDYELVSDIEPKFKKGDKIKHKVNTEWVCTIRRVEDRYYVDGHPTSYTILFDKQDEYELVPPPNKFDISTLKPFESKVLMRSSNAREWVGTIYSHYNNNKFYGCGMCCDQCIPYEGNEHLIGKTDHCNEYFKNW